MHENLYFNDFYNFKSFDLPDVIQQNNFHNNSNKRRNLSLKGNARNSNDAAKFDWDTYLLKTESPPLPDTFFSNVNFRL
jgi:hypothetical protein